MIKLKLNRNKLITLIDYVHTIREFSKIETTIPMLNSQQKTVIKILQNVHKDVLTQLLVRMEIKEMKTTGSKQFTFAISSVEGALLLFHKEKTKPESYQWHVVTEQTGIIFKHLLTEL